MHSIKFLKQISASVLCGEADILLFGKERGFLTQPAESHGGKSDHKPQQGKRHADLPHNVQRQCGIIPNVLLQSDIYKKPGGKFHCSDNSRTGKAFDGNRSASHRVVAYAVNQAQAKPACRSHGNVRLPATDHFQCRIHSSSGQK